MTLEDVKIVLMRKILSMFSRSPGVSPDPVSVLRRELLSRLRKSELGERWAMHPARRVKRFDERTPGEPPEFLKRKA